MRLVKSVLAVVLFGAMSAACFFHGRDDCRKDGACSGSGGGSNSGTGATTDNTTSTNTDPTCCEGGSCVDEVCCNGKCKGPCQTCTEAGACVAVPNDPACNEHGGCSEVRGHCRCDDGVKGDGEADVDCGGVCDRTCPIGASCQVASDCDKEPHNKLAYCVDGRCCNDACQGKCMACDTPNRPGLCAPKALLTTDGSLCQGDSACNGQGDCQKKDKSSCNVWTQCLSSNCNGASKCVACVDDANCAANSVCINGACIGKVREGRFCSMDKECSSTHCSHGVCCPTDCSGQCMSCRPEYTGKSGQTCAPVKAGLDPHDECGRPGDPTGCSGESDGTNGSYCKK